MNVLRMIKLFGWESKINLRIADKREEELKSIQWSKILDLCNNNLKCVCCPLPHLRRLNLSCSFFIPVMTMLATYTTYASSPVCYRRSFRCSHVLSDACYETRSHRLKCFLVHVGLRHTSRPAPRCVLDVTPSYTRFVIGVDNKVEKTDI